MLSVSSKIWTRVAVYISYDDNHYTQGMYFLIELFVLISHIWNSLCAWIELLV